MCPLLCDSGRTVTYISFAALKICRCSYINDALREKMTNLKYLRKNDVKKIREKIDKQLQENFNSSKILNFSTVIVIVTLRVVSITAHNKIANYIDYKTINN